MIKESKMLWDEFANRETSSCELGRKAFNRYCDHTDWKNFRGEPCPQFDELPTKIQEAWAKAANHIWDIARETPRAFFNHSSGA